MSANLAALEGEGDLSGIAGKRHTGRAAVVVAGDGTGLRRVRRT